ncbi:MAG: YlbF family regulator [Eubacterium sp.]|nr:YlbF family regulator [Eubacterium sp.]
MEDVIAASRHVNELLKESMEYRRFIHAKNSLRANDDLYQKLKELKARYVEVQTFWEGNPYDEIYRLCADNDWLLHNSVVNEYLRAESALSRLIRRLMDEITRDFPLDFE